MKGPFQWGEGDIDRKMEANQASWLWQRGQREQFLQTKEKNLDAICVQVQSGKC